MFVLFNSTRSLGNHSTLFLTAFDRRYLLLIRLLMLFLTFLWGHLLTLPSD
ncbi:Uncharacterised protein [Shimwellia blattae]|nr:Uncharacterised protein [Shimwellia blattae]VEC21357.1 Uncharacterised protein [Shimwellia blattae]